MHLFGSLSHLFLSLLLLFSSSRFGLPWFLLVLCSCQVCGSYLPIALAPRCTPLCHLDVFCCRGSAYVGCFLLWFQVFSCFVLVRCYLSCCFGSADKLIRKEYTPNAAQSALVMLLAILGPSPFAGSRRRSLCLKCCVFYWFGLFFYPCVFGRCLVTYSFECMVTMISMGY